MNIRLVIGTVVGVALLVMGLVRGTTVPLVIGGALIVLCGGRAALALRSGR